MPAAASRSATSAVIQREAATSEDGVTMSVPPGTIAAKKRTSNRRGMDSGVTHRVIGTRSPMSIRIPVSSRVSRTAAT